jgi:nucleoside recognition membrane protein YjiH
MKNVAKKGAAAKRLGKAVLSLMGVLLFLAPVHHQGILQVPIAVLIAAFKKYFGPYLPAAGTLIIVATAAIALIAELGRHRCDGRCRLVRRLIQPKLSMFVAQQAAAVIVLLVYFDMGPAFLCGATTGALILHTILPVVLASMLIAGLCLPLLLDFGLPERCGRLFGKIMRPLFRLPPPASVNCLSSWLGDGSVGIMITTGQYEKGHYTKREAATIATTFSSVSITFNLVVIDQVGLVHLFVPFYLTVCLAGIVVALVIVRLPPLAWKPETYFTPMVTGCPDPAGTSRSTDCIGVTTTDAGAPPLFPTWRRIMVANLDGVAAMIVTVLPIVVVVGTMALCAAEFTSVFRYLGMPLTPLMEWVRIPEAHIAATPLISGVADMLLPAMLSAGIENEMTRFFIAAMSVVQVIYLSETGALMMASTIPVNVAELLILFALRTLVALPVVALCVHLIF